MAIADTESQKMKAIVKQIANTEAARSYFLTNLSWHDGTLDVLGSKVASATNFCTIAYDGIDWHNPLTFQFGQSYCGGRPLYDVLANLNESQIYYTDECLIDVLHETMRERAGFIIVAKNIVDTTAVFNLKPIREAPVFFKEGFVYYYAVHTDDIRAVVEESSKLGQVVMGCQLDTVVEPPSDRLLGQLKEIISHLVIPIFDGEGYLFMKTID